MAVGSAKIEDSNKILQKSTALWIVFDILKITAHFSVQSLSSAFFRLFFFLANVNVVDSSSELFSEESANIPLYEFLDCGLLLRPEFELLPVFLFSLELLELPPAPRCLLRLLLRGLSSSSLSDSELSGESSPAFTRLFLDFLEEASLPEAFLRFELNCVVVVVVSSSLSLSSRSESVSAKAKRSMNFFFLFVRTELPGCPQGFLQVRMTEKLVLATGTGTGLPEHVQVSQGNFRFTRQTRLGRVGAPIPIRGFVSATPFPLQA